MGTGIPRSRDVLLAVGLSSRRQEERRLLPDRRSGIERRKRSLPVEVERRSGVERRQGVRRRADLAEGSTLLEKARNRLMRRPRSGSKEDQGDGLR